ncbi:hypothetical protein FPQ18DRAFT_382056 [Pyronema domesticum]|nr:hypothetical protein FPQ18DRAFT_382056 [Pyronema domesticum]
MNHAGHKRTDAIVYRPRTLLLFHGSMRKTRSRMSSSSSSSVVLVSVFATYFLGIKNFDLPYDLELINHATAAS